MNIDVHKVFAEYFKGTDDLFKAAVYAVSEKLEQGHICLDIEAYNTDRQSNADMPNPYLDTHEKLEVSLLKKSDFIGNGLDCIQPFILFEGKLYLQRYFNYQSIIYHNIKSRVATKEKVPTQSYLQTKKGMLLLNELFPPMHGIDWQKIATISALNHFLTIISGGPGTGKTTTISKILHLLFSYDSTIRVALCAPTGKAAARMMESLRTSQSNLPMEDSLKHSFDSIESGTIHKLLGYIRNSIYFRHNAKNRLPYDVVIVDECSMISAALLAKLLQAVHPTCHLMLLGDKHQLTSVEAGSIFGDLCSSIPQDNLFSEAFLNTISEHTNISSDHLFHPNTDPSPILLDHVITLQKSYRFADHKGIGRMAKEILNNNIDISSIKKRPKETSDFVYFTNDYQDARLDQYIEKYRLYIEEPDIHKAFVALNNVRFLCAVKEGPQGVAHYNLQIEKYLFGKKLLFPKPGFYHNQPIIITQNDYTHNLFNGDVGIIRREKGQALKAYFEDPEKGIKSISTAIIEHYDTVFAMTIHKSQGSEFNHVVIALPQRVNESLLSRQLLYTAVTRAKKDVLILGPDHQLQLAAKHHISRASGLVELLSKEHHL